MSKQKLQEQMTTRTEKTEKRYLANGRAKQLVNLVSGQYALTDSEAAARTVAALEGLAYPTVKSYLAAATHQIRETMGSEAARIYSDTMYAAVHAQGPWPKPKEKRTSAQKVKSCKSKRMKKYLERTLEKLLADKAAEGSTVGLANLTWAVLEMCRITGDRPIEVPKTEIRWLDGRTYILVQNAKATNGRGCGEQRGFSFDDPQMEIFNRLKECFGILKDFWSRFEDCGDPWAKIYGMARGRLYRVARVIFPGKCRLTFYYFRHALSADLKAAGMPRHEIAAIFGHKVDTTVGIHYASGRSGGARSAMPVADPDTVAKVQRKHVEFAGPKKAVAKVTPPPPPPPVFSFGPTLG